MRSDLAALRLRAARRYERRYEQRIGPVVDALRRTGELPNEECAPYEERMRLCREALLLCRRLAGAGLPARGGVSSTPQS